MVFAAGFYRSFSRYHFLRRQSRLANPPPPVTMDRPKQGYENCENPRPASRQSRRCVVAHRLRPFALARNPTVARAGVSRHKQHRQKCSAAARKKSFPAPHDLHAARLSRGRTRLFARGCRAGQGVCARGNHPPRRRRLAQSLCPARHRRLSARRLVSISLQLESARIRHLQRRDAEPMVSRSDFRQGLSGRLAVQLLLRLHV